MKFDQVFEAALKKYNSINEEWYQRTPEEAANSSRSLGELAGDFNNFIKQFLPGKDEKSLTPDERAEIGQAYLDAKQEYVRDQNNPRSPADEFGDQLRQKQNIARSAVEDTYEDEKGPLAPDYEHLSVLAPEVSNDEVEPTETSTESEPQTPPATTQSPTPASSQTQQTVYGSNIDSSIPGAVQVSGPVSPFNKQGQSYTAGYMSNQGTQQTSTQTSKPVPAQPATSSTENKPKVMPWTATKS